MCELDRTDHILATVFGRCGCQALRTELLLVVVTDLAEIFRLGTEKAEENLAFRRYLASHRYPEKPFQILASEIQQQIDCTLCANCCKYSIVEVTAADIEQIARHLGATAKAVTDLYTVAGDEGGGSRVLKRTKQGCVFLDGNLCMVYDARPSPCREFPHVAVGSHTLGGRHSSHGRWAALCPIIYNALEAYKKFTGYLSHPAQSGSEAGEDGNVADKPASSDPTQA